jgi:hypothetical protein
MPFKSQAQRRWMYATHPRMAARWSDETPKDGELPQHVKQASLFSFADELHKIEMGQPSLAHLIFGLGAMMLAMHLGSKSAEQSNDHGAFRKVSHRDVEGIRKIAAAARSAAVANSQSKARPTRNLFDAGFENSKGPQERVVG